MKDKLNIKGTATITIQKENGDVFNKVIDNIVVTTGKNFFANKIFNNDLNQRVAKIGIGSSATDQTIGDTITTFKSSTPTPIIKNIEFNNSGVDGNTINYLTNFFDTTGDTLLDGSNNPVPIRELALIALDEDSPEEEILLCRTTFEDSPQNEFTKTTSDIVTVTWRITIN